MKKKIVIIGIILIIIIIGVCIKFVFSDTNTEITLDMPKLAEELINAQIFEDQLNEVDKESIIKKYNLNAEKIKKVDAYVGTGATAEEILIMELLDKKDISETKKIMETQIEERKLDFQDYLPKEVFKLENYILESKGNYIVLCISNDSDKAKEIINKNINS